MDKSSIIKMLPMVMLVCLLVPGLAFTDPGKAQMALLDPMTATPAVEPTAAILEKMIIGRKYSFPNQSFNLILINGSTKTLFLSTFTQSPDSSQKPVETSLIGMRYGRTITFPDAIFGTVYVMRDVEGQVMAVYAVTADPRQIVRVTNLSLVAARAATPVRQLDELRSLWSGRGKNIGLRFVNKSSSPLLINWIDFNGREVFKARLEKDQQFRFDAFYGNVWNVRTGSGDALMAYFVTEADNQVVTITDEILWAIKNPTS